MPVYTYNGQHVHYKKLGSGKPLLMLHGWGSNSDVMLPLATKLSKTHTCYIPDLPGFGKSPAPDTAWSVDDYSDLTLSFIRDLDLEITDVLAHSFGGRIMLKLCARPGAEEQFGKIIITGGAGMKPRRKISFYFKKYMAKVLKAPFLLLPKRLREPSLDWLRKTPLWKSLGSGDYQKLQGVMQGTFVKVVSEYLEPCLPKIRHEILLLWGQNDDAAPLYQGQRIEQGVKSATLITIDQAGHYAFLDQPERFRLIAEAYYSSSS
ncbi:MAG: alpha/beta hydrolase [Balneolales bacterium]